MTAALPDAQLLSRLPTIEPRDELVLRLALREIHEALRGDRIFKDRIKFEILNPRPQEMAAIVAAAREAEANIDEKLAAAFAPPGRRSR